LRTSTPVWVPHLEQDRLIGPPPWISGVGASIFGADGRARGGRAVGGRVVVVAAMAAGAGRALRTGRGAPFNWGRGRGLLFGAVWVGTVPAAENRAFLPGGILFSGLRGPAS
jgi:hypothetical protein